MLGHSQRSQGSIPFQPPLGSPGGIADEREVVDKVLNPWEAKTCEPLIREEALERQDHTLLWEQLCRCHSIDPRKRDHSQEWRRPVTGRLGLAACFVVVRRCTR